MRWVVPMSRMNLKAANPNVEGSWSVSGVLRSLVVTDGEVDNHQVVIFKIINPCPSTQIYLGILILRLCYTQTATLILDLAKRETKIDIT